MSLDRMERAWLDARWAWLLETFGEEAPRAATAVVPDEDCFPDPYDGTPDAAGAMFTRVQGYMGLADLPVVLGFMQTEDPWFGHEHMAGGLTSGAAGLFTRYGGKPRVTIATGKLDDPMSLAATMAHELGHVQLIGLERITGEEPDQEPLTDLITVFLGLGVLNANAVVRDRSWETVGGSAWQISRLGYMSQEEFAYALALFARHRGESDPAWAKHLTADVRVPFQRYLKEASSPATDSPSLDELMRWRGARMEQALEGSTDDDLDLELAGEGRGLGWVLLVAVVALGLCLSTAVRSPSVPVYLVNGTPYDATVTVGGEAHALPPFERRAIEARPGTTAVMVEHRWDNSRFALDIEPGDQKRHTFVINVAGAAPLLVESQEYHPTSGPAPKNSYYEATLEFGKTNVKLALVDRVFEPWGEGVWTQQRSLSQLIVRRLSVDLGPPELVLAQTYPTSVFPDLLRWLDHLERLDPSQKEHLASLRRGTATKDVEQTKTPEKVR